MSSSPSFSFRLPPDLEDFVLDQVKKGEAKNPTDYFTRLVLKEKMSHEMEQKFQIIIEKCIERKLYSLETEHFIESIIEKTHGGKP